MTLTERQLDYAVAAFMAVKANTELIRSYAYSTLGVVPDNHDLAEILRGVADEIDPELD